MRLTGGSDKGRKLRAPRGQGTRPTSAKVREAIFNILGAQEGASVLDLYAGTGALGIEALSRGAARATFVEKSRKVADVIRGNVRELALGDRVAVMAMDVRAALRQLGAAGERFDWVFIDPPYASGEAEGVLLELAGSPVLSPVGVVVVEHGRRQRPPERAGDLCLTDRRSYGDTEVSFYRAGRS